MFKIFKIIVLLSFGFISFGQTNEFSPKQGSVKQYPSVKKSNEKNYNDNNYNFLSDYEHMSEQVKARINRNKSNNQKLSEGVYKIFKANVTACTSEEITQKLFSFLKNTEGFISTQFISKGTVQFFVIPEMNSSDFKEKLLTKNIKFNFLSEEYLLK